ncbi:Response regulator containing a CheY-like receiver domain and an HTH DNA-binding domain protein [Legionella birminghamensis]|uniref:Response regulator containing a CheY-like receiver domain and an HTH DNA-binding domain n=1 Tax=Legionella birminghamensis TaxID=28083 RepID=A0A378I935_9GAMM|nr:helix-turn-helix transcriptional regulator [Legionella birminghamensis]KTC68041.1 Response regulator containing a CheY-like receiver domain and an HTH DNA-binding domain protein [Legionella birminghamensis]STX31250.1 Response regulator containing a CheY-like receiver domain and an HTH DNA-binding domain [Legionella birminghamensis]
MNNIVHQLKNHPVFLETERLKKLCEPLQHLNISTFSHIRNYNNSNFSLLCNHPEFVLNYAEKEYYNADPCVQIKSEAIDFGEYIVWDMLDCRGLTAAMLKDSAEFNFKHVFTLVRQTADHADYFHFGTHLASIEVYQTYINNLDLLERFIEYFQMKVNEDECLALAYKNRLGFEKKDNLISLSKTSIPTCNRTLFLESLLQTPLSLREIECAQLLMTGRTTKEIAKALKLSPRTIEDKVESLKYKYRARNKQELIIRLLKGCP